MVKYYLKGLDCPSCATKIEKKMHKIDGLEEANINFTNKSVEFPSQYIETVQNIVSQIEPGVVLIPAAEYNERPKGYDINSLLEGQSSEVIKVITAAILFIFGIIFRDTLRDTPYFIGEYAVFLMAYLLVGGSVVWGAVKNLTSGQVFNEKFLMTVATTGAILIRELPEAVAVMLFFAFGEFFQDMAVNRSRRSITALLDLRSEYAHLVNNGERTQIPSEEVEVGDLIEIHPGERIPLDGDVVSGNSYVDTSALTGESVPKHVDEGDEVFSGMINEDGLLRVRVNREYEDSSVSKILHLVEQAASRKAPTEKFITKFASWYTPVMVGSALLLAVLPPIIYAEATFSEWVYRALVLLVISCPCALVFSIPLGYFGGIGGASRQGILVKGANFLDSLLKLDTVVFDKTGTLTEGVFQVTEIVPTEGFSRETLLSWAALAETHSNHPIAKSIKEIASQEPGNRIYQYNEMTGYGVTAVLDDGKKIVAGNNRLLKRENIPYYEVSQALGSVVHLGIDGQYAGYLVVSDRIKKGVPEAIDKLKDVGISNMIMLSGDEYTPTHNVAQKLGINEYYAELLPENKVNMVEKLVANLSKDNDTTKRQSNSKLAFVGDGINDAPVLTRADVGVAMGALGSDAAIEASDVVLMDDNLDKLSQSVKVARITRKIVLQNIVFALSVKAVFVVLGALGVASMWEAVFADVGVALIAIFNSTRTLKNAGKLE